MQKQYPEESGSGLILPDVEGFPQESLFKACDLEVLGGDFDEGFFGDDLLEEGELLAIALSLLQEPSADLIALQTMTFLLHLFSSLLLPTFK